MRVRAKVAGRRFTLADLGGSPYKEAADRERLRDGLRTAGLR